MNRFIARLGASIFAALIIPVVPAWANPSARVINGDDASVGEFPWMVALVRAGGDADDPYSGQFCGGALVGPQLVVTAAHCADAFTSFPEGVDVIVGRTRLSSSEGERHNVAGIVVHPDYNGNLLINDVAILKLSEASAITPLSLIVPGEESLWTPGTLATILGWGKTDPNYLVLPDLLQKAEVPIISAAVCSKAMGRFFKPLNMICAGKLASSSSSDDGIDTCNGDSGGPMVVASTTGPKLVGITSWGFGCATSKFYGVYTRVVEYAAWVLSNPAVPPRVLSYPSVSGSTEAGQTLSCDPGTWGGDDLEFSYVWRDDYTYEFLGSGQNYTLKDSDADRFVLCEVTASNSSGNYTSASFSVGPVISDGVIDEGTDDEIAPVIEHAKGGCNRRGKCSVVATVSDEPNGGTAASVVGEVAFKATRSRRSRVAQTEMSVEAKLQEGNTWRLSFQAPGRGKITVSLTASDSNGNTTVEPTRVKFKSE